MALTVESDVAEQLGLTEGQRQQLIEIIEARENEALELAIQLKGLPSSERAAKLAPFRQQSESRGLAILSKQQRARLQQIRVARWGLAGSLDSEAAERLKLSPQQQGKVAELFREQAERLAQADEKTAQAIRAETDRKVASALDPSQRAALQNLAGTAVPASASAEAGTPPVKAEPREVSATKAKPPEVKAEKAPESKPQQAAVPAAPETMGGATPPTGPGKPASPAPEAKAPVPAPPKAQGGPSSTADLAADSSDEDLSDEEIAAWEDFLGQLNGGSSGKPVAATERLAPAKSSDRLKFNFRYQAWKDVLDWFAETADLSLVGDSIPKGTFNYTDSREYTAAEAIDLLNSVLLTKGYTLVRRDRMLMIINLEDGIPPNLVKSISPEELEKRGEYELVEVLFQLQNVSPEEAELEIRKLMGPQGAVTVLPKSRQILVREAAGRLRVIRKAIQSIEDPQGAAARIRPIEIKYAEPQNVLNLVKQLVDEGSAHILLDPSGRRLLVTGKPEGVARVEEAVKAVDLPDPQQGDAPQLEVYTVNGADPNSVLKVLQTLLAGMPDVRLEIDSKTGNLIAMGRRSAHSTIKATLEQLQRDGRRLEVFQLRTLDPQLAVAAITKLYGSDTGPGSPKIDADPYSRQLLVRASDTQIQQIRSMLEQMGESVTSKANSGNVRMVPLTGRAARTALERLQDVWPEVRGNRIRVVTPSAAGISTHRPSASPDAPSQKTSAPDGLDSPAPQLPPEVLERLKKLLESPANAPAPPPGSPREPSSMPPTTPLPKAPSPPAPPATPGPAKPSGEKSAGQSEDAGRGTARIRFATQVVAAEAAVSASDATKPKAAPPASSSPTKPGPAEPAKSPAATAPAKPALPKAADREKESPPIIVTPSPGGVIIASRDQEALDEIEQLLGTLAGNFLSGKPEFTVFYLKHAKAPVVAETLDQILGGGTGGSGGGGSLMGDLAGAALGDVGGGLLGTLLGGADGGKASGPVQITADARLNALFVRAKPADLDTIEDLLKLLDEKASPEEILASPKPQLIPVFNTQADELANVVRQVYQDRLAGSAGANRQPTPQDFIMAMRNLRGGRGGGGAQRGTQEEPVKLSIGVDARTNSLIVAAPDALFQEVKDLVEQLDRAAMESNNQVLQVVTLQRSNSDTIRQALSAMMGNSVQFGSAGASSASAPNAQQPSPFGFGSRRFGFPGMMGMGGGFSGGGFPGGGFPGGGFTGGGFPGGGFPGGGFTPNAGSQSGRFGGGRFPGGGTFNPGSMPGGGTRGGGMNSPGGRSSSGGGGSGRRSSRGSGS